MHLDPESLFFVGCNGEWTMETIVHDVTPAMVTMPELMSNARASFQAIHSGMKEPWGGRSIEDQKLHALRAFHWITRGNATVLGLERRIGTLDAGTEADIVVLNACATPAMDLRMNRVECLSEELFVVKIMGDDRAIAQTYFEGEPQKSDNSSSVKRGRCLRRHIQASNP